MHLTITQEHIDKANYEIGLYPHRSSIVCPIAQAMKDKFCATVAAYCMRSLYWDSDGKEHSFCYSKNLTEQVKNWDEKRYFVPGRYLLTPLVL